VPVVLLLNMVDVMMWCLFYRCWQLKGRSDLYLFVHYCVVKFIKIVNNINLCITRNHKLPHNFLDAIDIV